jgi:hypothetical protein
MFLINHASCTTSFPMRHATSPKQRGPRYAPCTMNPPHGHMPSISHMQHAPCTLPYASCTVHNSSSAKCHATCPMQLAPSLMYHALYISCMRDHAPCTIHSLTHHAPCTMHFARGTMHHAQFITPQVSCPTHHATCTLPDASCTLHHVPVLLDLPSHAPRTC